MRIIEASGPMIRIDRGSIAAYNDRVFKNLQIMGTCMRHRLLAVCALLAFVGTSYAQRRPTVGQCRNLDDAFISNYHYVSIAFAVGALLLPIVLALLSAVLGWWWLTAPRKRWGYVFWPLFGTGIVLIVVLPTLAARGILPPAAAWYATPGYLDCMGTNFRENRSLMWLYSTGGRPAILTWIALFLGFLTAMGVSAVTYFGVTFVSRRFFGLRSR